MRKFPNTFLSPYFAVFLLLFVLACTTGEQREEATTSPPLTYDETIKLPPGFKAVPVVDSIGRGRHLAVRANGDIYLQLRRLNDDGHGTVALRDTNGDIRADIIDYFGDQSGTGMAIHNNYLYASSDTSVFRYPLPDEQLAPAESGKQVIAEGFINQDQHATKSFTLDDSGNLFVNVGAPSNACMEQRRTKGSPGVDPCPQLERQAGIWKFNAYELNQDQEDDGSRYATGIRNAVAVQWNPMTKSLFALQHGRDQLSQFFPEMFNDTLNAELPSEEFFEVNENDDFGWPYCYYDHLQDKKLLAPEYGGDMQKQGRCESAKDPLVAFPGHMGPNDLIFYQGDQFPEKYRSGAFIAFHGSWNRAPLRQKGYFVVFIPMEGNRPAGDWEIFADGFSGLDSDEGQRETKYRPTGLALGPDGSLYVSDSVNGKIWKIVYEG